MRALSGRWLPALAAAWLLPCFLPGETAAQEVDAPLSPAGRLRIEVSASVRSWDRRFGVRTSSSGTVEEVEPLGYDLNHDRFGAESFPVLADLEQNLRAATGDPTLAVSLGRTRADIQRTVIRAPIRLDLGITDWLTAGITVPLYRQRTDVAFSLSADEHTANLGLAPTLDDPTAAETFLGSLEQALEEMQIQAASTCEANPGSPECVSAASAYDEGLTFFQALSAGYQAYLFPFGGSAPAAALEGRVADIAALFEEHGVTSMPAPSTMPFASGPLSSTDFGDVVSSSAVGVVGSPPGDWQGGWELGDVELSGALRLLEWTRDPGSGSGARTAAAEPTSAAPGPLRPTSALVGAGATVRLPTGRVDFPNHFFDRGSGDGQMDLEVRVFGDLELGRRFGVWGDLRYGVQMEGDVVRRMAPPDLVFPPLSSRADLRWTPGNYLDAEIAPRIRLTPELALAGRYRHFTKGDDRYELVSPGEATVLYDASVLEAETSRTIHEVGISAVYSTLAASGAGGAARPFEARVRYSWAAAGSGGQTPKYGRLEVGFRSFWSLWGDS